MIRFDAKQANKPILFTSKRINIRLYSLRTKYERRTLVAHQVVMAVMVFEIFYYVCTFLHTLLTPHLGHQFRSVGALISVADPDGFGPDPDPTSENRPDPDSDPDPVKTGSGSGFI